MNCSFKFKPVPKVYSDTPLEDETGQKEVPRKIPILTVAKKISISPIIGSKKQGFERYIKKNKEFFKILLITFSIIIIVIIVLLLFWIKLLQKRRRVKIGFYLFNAKSINKTT